MLCLATAGAVTALTASSFTLSWTHSVEKTQWREAWQALDMALQPVKASVEGAGAGIDLPADAVWAVAVAAARVIATKAIVGAHIRLAVHDPIELIVGRVCGGAVRQSSNDG